MSHTDDIAAKLRDLKTLKRIYDEANKEMQHPQFSVSADDDTKVLTLRLIEGAGAACDAMWWLLERQGVTAVWNGKEYEQERIIDTASTMKE